MQCSCSIRIDASSRPSLGEAPDAILGCAAVAGVGSGRRRCRRPAGPEACFCGPSVRAWAAGARPATGGIPSAEAEQCLRSLETTRCDFSGFSDRSRSESTGYIRRSGSKGEALLAAKGECSASASLGWDTSGAVQVHAPPEGQAGGEREDRRVVTSPVPDEVAQETLREQRKGEIRISEAAAKTRIWGK